MSCSSVVLNNVAINCMCVCVCGGGGGGGEREGWGESMFASLC